MKIPQWLQNLWNFWDWLDEEANPELQRRFVDWFCEQVYKVNYYLEEYTLLCVVIGLLVIAIIIIYLLVCSNMKWTRKYLDGKEKKWEGEEELVEFLRKQLKNYFDGYCILPDEVNKEVIYHDLAFHLAKKWSEENEQRKRV